MEFRVDVTAHDIKHGRSKASFCPIALALKRTLKTHDVSVFDDQVTVDGFDLEFGSGIASFVNRFDDGLKVTPRAFVFKLKQS